MSEEDAKRLAEIREADREWDSGVGRVASRDSDYTIINDRAFLLRLLDTVAKPDEGDLFDKTVEALIWDCDRAVKQALRTLGAEDTGVRMPNGMLYETCITHILKPLWNAALTDARRAGESTGWQSIETVPEGQRCDFWLEWSDEAAKHNNVPLGQSKWAYEQLFRGHNKCWSSRPMNAPSGYSIYDVAALAGLPTPRGLGAQRLGIRLVRLGWTRRLIRVGAARSSRRWFPPVDLPATELDRYLPLK